MGEQLEQESGGGKHTQKVLVWLEYCMEEKMAREESGHGAGGQHQAKKVGLYPKNNRTH